MLWDINKITSEAVELFEHQNLVVSTIRKGSRTVLKRSPAMENFANQVGQKVIDDFHNQTDLYDGLIYLMLKHSNGLLEPLYIGKSNKYGIKDKNLNCQFTKKYEFFRWGYNTASHIGDLSLFACGPLPVTGKQNYLNWANVLFVNHPTNKPTLNHDILYWVKAWPHHKNLPHLEELEKIWIRYFKQNNRVCLNK